MSNKCRKTCGQHGKHFIKNIWQPLNLLFTRQSWKSFFIDYFENVMVNALDATFYFLMTKLFKRKSQKLIMFFIKCEYRNRSCKVILNKIRTRNPNTQLHSALIEFRRTARIKKNAVEKYSYKSDTCPSLSCNSVLMKDLYVYRNRKWLTLTYLHKSNSKTRSSNQCGYIKKKSIF